MKIKTTFIAFLLSIPILIGMLEVSLAAGVSEKDLKAVEKKAQAQSIEHKKLQAQAMQINMELNEVSQEMIKTARLIQSNEDNISRMEKTLEELKVDLETAEKNFLKEDDYLIKTLAALQNLALKPTEALFVQPLTPVDIIRSAILLRETVPYLEENAERIRKELMSIENKKIKVENQYKKISRQKDLLIKEHEKMKVLVQKKSKMRNAVEIKSVQAKQKVEKLASQAQDLRDLLNKIEKQQQEKKRKEEERKRLAEQKAAEENKKLAEAKKDSETQTADLIKSSQQFINENTIRFSQAKGKLSMPARGSIITSFGEQKVKGVSSKGIIIRTRNLAQVISPYDGTVVFSGPFRGYGNMIIIEHGEGYLSLLAGLDNLDVEPGQLLLAGEPVGIMSKTGEAKLYVELRKDNKPIDPLPWMAN